MIAIARAKERGYEKELSNSTLYVTLEPCSHYGKTPPCTELIYDSKIPRVVIGLKDTNKEVDGIGWLKEKGVTVLVDAPNQELIYQNRAFIKQQLTGLPWITAKMAISIDGKIAMPSGDSNWLSNEESRHNVQHLRSRVGAIITGRKTIESDNPRLNVRLENKNNPDVYILSKDSHYKLSDDKNVLKTENRKINILSDIEFNSDLIKKIADNSNTNHLLLEAGSELFTQFYKTKLIDELIIYQAPFIMGNGNSLANSFQLNSLGDREDFYLYDLGRIQNDIKMVYLKADNKGLLNL